MNYNLKCALIDKEIREIINNSELPIYQLRCILKEIYNELNIITNNYIEELAKKEIDKSAEEYLNSSRAQEENKKFENELKELFPNSEIIKGKEGEKLDEQL